MHFPETPDRRCNAFDMAMILFYGIQNRIVHDIVNSLPSGVAVDIIKQYGLGTADQYSWAEHGKSGNGFIEMRDPRIIKAIEHIQSAGLNIDHEA